MKDNSEMPYFLNFDMNEWSSKNGWTEYEICYWRKWWGFRNEVVSSLNMLDKDCVVELSVADVKAIREILIGYLTLKYDITNLSTVWTFEELMPHIASDIVSLTWLIDFMKQEAGNIIVEFYDSY